jgi:hypothetical protein
MNWSIAGVTDFGLYSVPIPPFDDNNPTDVMKIVSYIFNAIFYTAILALFYWVEIYRDHPIVKLSQPKFLKIVLLGCAIGLTAALAEIEMTRGRLYAATVVDACLRVFHERGYRFSD